MQMYTFHSFLVVRNVVCVGSGSSVGTGVGTGVGTNVGTGVGTGVGTSIGDGVGDGVGTGVGRVQKTLSFIRILLDIL